MQDFSQGMNQIIRSEDFDKDYREEFIFEGKKRDAFLSILQRGINYQPISLEVVKLSGFRGDDLTNNLACMLLKGKSFPVLGAKAKTLPDDQDLSELNKCRYQGNGKSLRLFAHQADPEHAPLGFIVEGIREYLGYLPAEAEQYGIGDLMTLLPASTVELFRSLVLSIRSEDLGFSVNPERQLQIVLASPFWTIWTYLVYTTMNMRMAEDRTGEKDAEGVLYVEQCMVKVWQCSRLIQLSLNMIDDHQNDSKPITSQLIHYCVEYMAEAYHLCKFDLDKLDPRRPYSPSIHNIGEILNCVFTERGFLRNPDLPVSKINWDALCYLALKHRLAKGYPTRDNHKSLLKGWQNERHHFGADWSYLTYRLSYTFQPTYAYRQDDEPAVTLNRNPLTLRDVSYLDDAIDALQRRRKAKNRLANKRREDKLETKQNARFAFIGNVEGGEITDPVHKRKLSQLPKKARKSTNRTALEIERELLAAQAVIDNLKDPDGMDSIKLWAEEVDSTSEPELDAWADESLEAETTPELDAWADEEVNDED